MGTKKTAQRYWGCHVSAAGGIERALSEASKLEINTIQLHPSPPQRWLSKAFAPGVEKAFLAALPESGVAKVFFHGIYLINLANPDAQQFHLSKMSLVYYLDLISRVNGEGVIFHLGSLKDQPDDRVGLQRAADGINWVLDQSPNKGRLLLEVAAGSGRIIGARMEEVRTVYDLVEDKSRVAFALDTQHLWASGYDLKDGLDDFVAEVDRVFGLERVKAIHLNDSKTELASRKDRHENLGDGLIGLPALTQFFLRPEFSSIPFILETPNMKDAQTAREDVNKLRAMLKNGA